MKINIWDTLDEATFKGATLGIPRSDMPQIKQEDIAGFLVFLRKLGIKYREETIAVGKLKPTQKDFSEEKVKGMMKDMTIAEITNTVFLASQDNYTADGHHRYVAARRTSPHTKVKILRVMLSIVELLNVIKKYPKSFSKTINEEGMAGGVGSSSSVGSVAPHAAEGNASGEKKKDILVMARKPKIILSNIPKTFTGDMFKATS
jgi:hypothetical protein